MRAAGPVAIASTRNPAPRSLVASGGGSRAIFSPRPITSKLRRARLSASSAISGAKLSNRNSAEVARRDRVDAAGRGEDRADMAHPGEAEAAGAVGVDDDAGRGRSPQRPALTPAPSRPPRRVLRRLVERVGAHAHVDQHRRADEDRGIGRHADAPDHRRRERADHVAAEEEQRQQRQEHRRRRHDRARQHRVDRHVDDLGGRQFLVFAHHFADAVEHDDGLVERIADDGENRGDRGLVELELREGEEADRQQQIVHRADDRADRELPFEAEPQIGQHRQDRDDDAERARSARVRPRRAGRPPRRCGTRSRSRTRRAAC